MAVGKHPQSPGQSPSKRPVRKRRVNTMLYNPYEVPAASRVTAKAPPGVDIPTTPASKTPRLRLNITSHRVSATPSLILHRPKSHTKRRSEPVINVSSSPLAELPNNPDDPFDSVPQPDPKDTQALIAYGKNPRSSFARILARRSLSLIERSDNPYLYRSSQSNNVPRHPALPDTPPNSQLDDNINSQVTYDDTEDHKKRRRAEEASQRKDRRSRPQRKDQEVVNPKTKTQLSKPPNETRYKLNVESF